MPCTIVTVSRFSNAHSHNYIHSRLVFQSPSGGFISVMMLNRSVVLLVLALYVNCSSALMNQGKSFCPRNVPKSMSLLLMAGENKALTIPKNYNVAVGSAATSAALIFGAHNIIAGIPFGLLGLLLFIQTGKVRFVFDGEAMEVFVAKKGEKGEDINASRENFVVGGKNRWKYNTFTDWFFIPSKNFPILMYFKENQTSAEGQIHLFPVIMDGKVLYNQLMEKVGSVSSSKN